MASIAIGIMIGFIAIGIFYTIWSSGTTGDRIMRIRREREGRK